jgi:proline iminopeptidase
MRHQSTLLLIALAIFVGCNDQPTTNTNTITPAGDSTSVPQYVTIGGIQQAILVRGVDTTHPILLMLHGGPGFTEMALFSTYNKDLEKQFIVVNYDQRGSGLSYAPGIPDSTINIQQYVNDAHELVTWLKKRYNKEKIFVLGHSWGTTLGVKLVEQFPNDFYAYIGVAQVVDMEENEKQTLQFTLDTAIAENNKEAIAQLKDIQTRYPPNGKVTMPDLFKQRYWLEHYGGTVYKEQNYGKIFSRISQSINPLYDTARSAAGGQFVLINLADELMEVDLTKTTTKLQVPVYFLLGRHDYTTPFKIAEDYFNLLQAPYKEIIWFENSAHMIPFEEPEKFNEVIMNKVRKHSNP